MKKLLSLIIIMMQAVFVMAQDGVLTVTKPCVIDYRFDYVSGKMKMLKYLRVTTNSVTKNDESLEIVYTLDYLNKKKEIQKATNITDGLQTSFTVSEDGSYYLQDMLYGVGKDLVRNGFKLQIPKDLAVGDVVKSGRSYGTYKLMGNVKFDFNFNDFKVTAEEDVETAAGTYHCYKIEGSLSGKVNNAKVGQQHTLWIAPNIGVVKMEYITSPKIYFNLIIDTVSDL